MKQKKLFILLIVLIAWAVFSAGYIGYRQWQQFKDSKMQQAYQQGISYAVDQIIAQSAKCLVLPLYSGDKKANLIDTGCLNGAGQATTTTEQ